MAYFAVKIHDLKSMLSSLDKISIQPFLFLAIKLPNNIDESLWSSFVFPDAIGFNLCLGTKSF